MNVPTNIRGYLYIAAAILAVGFGIAVACGFVTQDIIVRAVVVAGELFAAFTGLLARLNLSDS